MSGISAPVENVPQVHQSTHFLNFGMVACQPEKTVSSCGCIAKIVGKVNDKLGNDRLRASRQKNASWSGANQKFIEGNGKYTFGASFFALSIQRVQPQFPSFEACFTSFRTFFTIKVSGIDNLNANAMALIFFRSEEHTSELQSQFHLIF